MILLVEAGGTKTDLCLLQKDNTPIREQIHGFNVNHGNSDIFLQKVNIFIEKNGGHHHLSDAYYFVAGISEDNKDPFELVLKKTLSIPKVHLHSDIDIFPYLVSKVRFVGAILGTGANMKVFGRESEPKNGFMSLGYILGDEGGGAYFGKQLLRSYLYREMHAKATHLSHRFEKEYGQLAHQWKSVYTHPQKAAAYLGSFFGFVLENRKEPLIQSLIYKGINAFLSPWRRSEYDALPIHFIGGVACNLREEISSVVSQHSPTDLYFHPNVMDELVEEFQKKLLLQE